MDPAVGYYGVEIVVSITNFAESKKQNRRQACSDVISVRISTTGGYIEAPFRAPKLEQFSFLFLQPKV